MTIELTAYRYSNTEGWDIVPAGVKRDWMDQSLGKAALRCLPLAIANQAGWFVTCPATFKARWKSRSTERSALEISFQSSKDEIFRKQIGSNFGSGIITFVLPWLFRTSEGYGLWARGPSNMPRAEAYALEGMIETDWSPYPFTMNWKITKPKIDVWFKKGDPICMITPYPISCLEEVEPRMLDMVEDPTLSENFAMAAKARLHDHATGTSLGGKYELNYTRGFRPDGEQAPTHITNLKLKVFEME